MLDALRHPWDDVSLRDPDAPTIDVNAPIADLPRVTNPGNIDHCHGIECEPIDTPFTGVGPDGDGS